MNSDHFEAFLHRMDMAEQAAIAGKLAHLNKRELLCLASHFGFKYAADDYAAPGTWKRCGRETIISELADHIIANEIAI